MLPPQDETAMLRFLPAAPVAAASPAAPTISDGQEETKLCPGCQSGGEQKNIESAIQQIIRSTATSTEAKATAAIRAAPHTHRMRVAIVSLPREVALRMTVQAPRIPQHRDERGEQSTVIGRCGRSEAPRRGRIFRSTQPAGDQRCSGQD